MVTLKNISLLLILIFTIGLTGCATNATTENMTYSHPTTKKPIDTVLVNAINVEDVSGGSETNPLWLSSVNNENFKLAIIDSFKSAHLYEQLGHAHYMLNAQLMSLDRPWFGIDLTVTCKVHYHLYSTKNKKVLFDKDITSSYTAIFSDSVIAISRLRLANEGAIKTNIKQLIDDLYLLPMDQ